MTQPNVAIDISHFGTLKLRLSAILVSQPPVQPKPITVIIIIRIPRGLHTIYRLRMGQTVAPFEERMTDLHEAEDKQTAWTSRSH
jgi:hypothetical protein